MSLVGVRDIIGTTRENSSIYAACERSCSYRSCSNLISVSSQQMQDYWGYIRELYGWYLEIMRIQVP